MRCIYCLASILASICDMSGKVGMKIAHSKTLYRGESNESDVIQPVEDTFLIITLHPNYNYLIIRRFEALEYLSAR